MSFLMRGGSGRRRTAPTSATSAVRRLSMASIAGLCLMVVAACGAGSSDTADASGSQLIEVGVAYPSATTTETALWVGVEKGFFAKNGLDVTPKMISASPALASLTHDQVQFADIGVAPALTSISRGLPVRIIATDSGMPTWDLVGGNGITSVSQLRGGIVATGTESTLSDVVTRLALQKAGLDPGKDVRLVLVGQAGNTPERIAALASGKVQAAVIDAGSLSKLGANPHVLLPYQSLRSVLFAGGGIEASSSYLASHGSVAVSFLRAYEQSVAYARDPKNEAAVLSVDAKYLQATGDEASIKDSVDLAIASLPKSIKTDPRAIGNTIKALNQSSSSPISVDLSTVVDNSYVDKAGAAS
jgi:ABC-type nitrate/sulfonate/bicarbonate transport system substrate-binding protein